MRSRRAKSLLRRVDPGVIKRITRFETRRDVPSSALREPLRDPSVPPGHFLEFLGELVAIGRKSIYGRRRN